MRVAKRSRSAIQGDRESTRLAATLGRDVNGSRERLGLTQDELGRRVGLSQARTSAVERGLGGTLPLASWVALGLALERPLAVSLSRPLADEPALADAGHLDMQEAVLRLLRPHGWSVRVELATRRAGPAHSVDVAARTRDGRYLLLEIWNRIWTGQPGGGSLSRSGGVVAGATDRCEPHP